MHRLINPSKTDDVLFLTGIILNILDEKEDAEDEQSILPELFNTMGLESTINLIKYFGGETIRIPSHEKMYKSFLIMVCYYKRKIEDKSWEDIKNEVGVDISPHTLGKVIKSIDDRINLNIKELNDMGIEDFMKELFSNGRKPDTEHNKQT